MTLASEVTRRLHGDWHGSFGLVPGPGHGKKDRSLSVRQDPNDCENVVLHSFAGDRWEDIKDEWRRDGILPSRETSRRLEVQFSRRRDPARRIETSRRRDVLSWKHHAEREIEKADRLAVAQNLWDRSESAERSVVETYLRGRGIEIKLPITVRYLPASPPRYPWPAMICAFALPSEPEPGVMRLDPDRIAGIHLTLLQPDGRGKAPVTPARKMVGHSTGFPIVLAQPGDGLSILVCEGVESGFSALMAASMGVWAAASMGVWAAASAGRMPSLAAVVPSYIECVTIAVEADPAGQRGANTLAERLAARNIEVFIAEAGRGL